MQAKVYYMVDTIIKFSEEDIYNSGCQGSESGNTWSEKPCMQDETIEKLIERCMEFAGQDDRENVQLNACGEDGRLDIQVYEDANGDTLSKKALENWKKGNGRVWLANYSFYIEKHIIEPANLEE